MVHLPAWVGPLAAAVVFSCELSLMLDLTLVGKHTHGSTANTLRLLLYLLMGLGYLCVLTRRPLPPLYDFPVWPYEAVRWSAMRATTCLLTWPWLGLFYAVNCLELLYIPPLVVGPLWCIAGLFGYGGFPSLTLRERRAWALRRIPFAAIVAITLVQVQAKLIVATGSSPHDQCQDRTVRSVSTAIAKAFPWVVQLQRFSEALSPFTVVLAFGLIQILPGIGLELREAPCWAQVESIVHVTALLLFFYPSLLDFAVKLPVPLALVLAAGCSVVGLAPLCKFSVRRLQRCRCRGGGGGADGGGGGGGAAQPTVRDVWRPCDAWQRAKEWLLLRTLRSDQASTWSVDQVIAFAALLGLRRHARVLRLGAVNGLLLMALDEGEVARGLRLPPAHAVSVMAGIRLLRATGAGPAADSEAQCAGDALLPEASLSSVAGPPRTLHLSRWGWGASDVGDWLHFLGLGCLRAPLAEAAIHGAVLFLASPEALSGMVNRADSEALGSRNCNLPVLYAALKNAVDGVRGAYATNTPARTIIRRGWAASGHRICRPHLCCKGSTPLPCLARRTPSAAWGAEAIAGWLVSRGLPYQTAKLLASLGCSGHLLLSPDFETAVIPALTGRLALMVQRRLQLEVTRLRAANGNQEPLTGTFVIPEPTAPQVTQASMAQCCICLEPTANHICVPCGHRVACSECAPQLQAQRSVQCPICRTMVREFVRLYDD
eukprot:NODE_1122_length_2597_cov_8.506073.p1 GENE.NODE_1122_length_2597_cov_8.506073~~NODE_1122_length_2597_cov_8.506073.p1  ORF type:complete len:715 (+),score=142.87 NODE_1122_length_2597_cov_8.506073:89-2233(+)